MAFLWLRFRKNYPRRFLLLLILCFCSIEFYMYALSSRSILSMPFLYRTAFPWRFLMGPFLWLYVLNMIKPDRKWTYTDLLHFIIPIIMIINLIPDFLLGSEQKRLIMEAFYRENTVFMTRSTGILPPGIIQPLSLLHGLFYCCASIFLLLRYRITQRLHSQSVNNQVWKWAGMLTGVTTFFIMFQVVQWLTLSIDNHFSVFAQISQSISLIAMKAYLLIHPVVIENMDGVIPVGTVQNEAEDQSILPVCKKQVRYSQYEPILEAYWGDQKNFLKQDHTIGEMAEDLGMSKSKLSAVLAGVYGMSYTEIINRYRIDHFLEQIKRGEGQKMKLEVLIQNSGFQYRSTFYSAFKKIMGKPPKEVLK